VNTSGAYIPGHGTPTVLLFGTAEPPVEDQVLTVLASRGEPSTPDDPEQGLVWRSIAGHWDEVGFENEYISVTRTEREQLRAHPCSLSGGGATELKALLEKRAESTLGALVQSIGFASFSGEDDVFLAPRGTFRRMAVETDLIRDLVKGEDIRDWTISSDLEALCPYDMSTHEATTPGGSADRHLWHFRTLLAGTQGFGGKSKTASGTAWWEWFRWIPDRYRGSTPITFAYVATHNHFVLGSSGQVYRGGASAPIIKLPESATEDDHYALLAYLNSSTACFWMKQVGQEKTVTTGEKILQPDPAKIAYEFPSTALKEMPTPEGLLSLSAIGRRLHEAAEERKTDLEAICERWTAGKSLADLIDEDLAHLERICSLQEALDLRVYRLFDLIEESEQALEELLSRFEQPGHRLPPDQRAYCKLDRAATVALGRKTGLLESAMCKRRWLGVQGRFAAAGASIEDVANEQLDVRIGHHLEMSIQGLSRPVPLHDLLRTMSSFRAPAALDTSTRAQTLFQESLPYLAALRYTPSGLEKYAAWEHTWELQRKEDAGENVGEIPVPPKYDSKDFRSSTYWSLRGKLDVPKERFISYPGCESDDDGEPVYGWAGWNHRQRAVALATLYTQRKSEGWAKDRLQPLLAGLLELLPWLEQWHGEPDADFDGAVPAVQFREFLDAECADHGFTYDDLRSWRPAEKKARKSAKRKARKESETSE